MTVTGISGQAIGREETAARLAGPLFDLPIPAGLRRGLTRFGSWWAGELAAMLPGPVFRSIVQGTAMPVLEISDEAVTIYAAAVDGTRIERARSTVEGSGPEAVTGAVERAVRRSGLKPGSIFVKLPDADCLDRIVRVPDADRRTLQGLFSYDLDRWMPVSAQTAMFSFKVLHRDPQAGTASIALVCVRPEALDRVRTLVPHIGRFAGFVHETGGAAIPLRTADQIAAASARSKRTRLGALLGVGALLAAFAGPWGLLTAERNALEDRLETVRTDARQVAVQLRSMREAQAVHAEAGARMFAAPPVSVTLARLTAALPDDTWLDHLSLRTQAAVTSVEIKGISPSGPAVLDALDKESVFGNVTFAAPTTIIPASRNERYAITLTVSGEREGDRP